MKILGAIMMLVALLGLGVSSFVALGTGGPVVYAGVATMALSIFLGFYGAHLIGE
jgi:hypothetical protein